MGWLTTYGATNLVELSEHKQRERRTVLSVLYYRDNSVVQSEYRGMTEGTADTCLAAVNDPANGVNAAKQRESEGGGYKVVLTTLTEGTWT